MWGALENPSCIHKKISNDKLGIKTGWALSENVIWELAGSAENFP